MPNSNTANRWIGGFSRVIPARVMALFVSQRVRAPEMAPNPADLITLTGLIESGKLTPVIEQTYPLIEVPQAIRHLRQGHTRGNLVITI